jgi:hypothetical protein
MVSLIAYNLKDKFYDFTTFLNTMSITISTCTISKDAGNKITLILVFADDFISIPE